MNTDPNYYLPSFYTIYMNSSKSLDEFFGSNEEHCLFHEYIHYLEDILTTYGVTSSSQKMNNIKALYHHAKDLEKSDAILTSGEDLDEISDLNKKLFKLYLQYKPDIEHIPFEESIYKIGQVPESVEFPDGSKKSINTYLLYLKCGKKIKFGGQALMESVSHILEKNIYKIESEDYIIPYDLAYMIWIHYLPNEKDNLIALLDLEEFSLQFYNPSEIFISTLEKITAGEIELTPNFYKQLMVIWHTNDGKSALELYEFGIKQLKEDIEGVFVADVYAVFKECLLQILDKALEFNKKGEPLFSVILAAYDKDNISDFFDKFGACFGMPTVINADGGLADFWVK